MSDFDFLSPAMSVFDSVQPHRTLFDFARFCSTILYIVRLCSTLFDFTGHCSALFDFDQLYRELAEESWTITKLGDHCTVSVKSPFKNLNLGSHKNIIFLVNLESFKCHYCSPQNGRTSLDSVAAFIAHLWPYFVIFLFCYWVQHMVQISRAWLSWRRNTSFQYIFSSYSGAVPDDHLQIIICIWVTAKRSWHRGHL